MLSKFQLFVVSLFASRVPTRMRPFSELSKVSVLIDSDARDAAPAEMEVRKYFSGKNMEVEVIGVGNKNKARPDRNADMIISLLPEDSFWLEWQLRRSRARFKAGRFQLQGDILDFVLSENAEQKLPQLDYFREMEKIFEKTA